MARPSHKPDEDMRHQVEALAGYGVREDEIAEFIGIDPKTLRRHYRSQLRRGHTKANAKVAENLYRRATGESREAVTAAIFWLKTRAGWRETFAHELSGREGAPIEIEHDPRKLARVIFGLLQEARLEDARAAPARLPPPSLPCTDTGYPA